MVENLYAYLPKQRLSFFVQAWASYDPRDKLDRKATFLYNSVVQSREYLCGMVGTAS